MSNNFAFTSVLATDDYLGGALGLYYSLQMAKSKYPFHLLVTDNVSREVRNKLDEIGVLYSIVPLINFIDGTGRYEVTFNKFHIFSLKQYDKVCFIDCDAILKENIDDIFSFEAPGFPILDEVFLSGVIILMNPCSKNVDDFLEYKSNPEDESVWNTIYKADGVSDLFSYFGKIFHFSSCGEDSSKKYWRFYSLNELEPLINFMYSNEDFSKIESLYY